MARPKRHNIQIADLDVQRVADDYTPPHHYLREWREFKRLTQEQFAELLGTSKSQISDLENSNRGLGYKWLWKASEALKIRPGFILEHDPEELPTDIIEIWATIPEGDRQKARAILETLTIKAS